VGAEDLELARHRPTMARGHPGANWSAAGR
jgi:hypothetical protein